MANAKAQTGCSKNTLNGRFAFTATGFLVAPSPIAGSFAAIGAQSSDYRYDVSADGERFLVAMPRAQKSSESLTLVYNWTALLKKK
jgi:hypothetical protein